MFKNRILTNGETLVGYTYYDTQYTYSGYEFEDESHIFSWRTNKDILVKEETIGQYTRTT